MNPRRRRHQRIRRRERRRLAWLANLDCRLNAGTFVDPAHVALPSFTFESAMRVSEEFNKSLQVEVDRIAEVLGLGHLSPKVSTSSDALKSLYERKAHYETRFGGQR